MKLLAFLVLTALSGSTLAQTVVTKPSEARGAKTQKVVISIPGARLASQQSRGSLSRVEAGLGTAVSGVAAVFTGETGSAVAVQKSGTTGGN